MSKREKRTGKAAAVSGGGPGELDAARDGSSPLEKAPPASTNTPAGSLLTEATYLEPPPMVFVESPFGQRYASRRPKTIGLIQDVGVRIEQWQSSCIGYKDYGTVAGTPVVPGYSNGERVLQDWYSYSRDMGKRALKYKHLPVNLSDENMLIYIMDVYHYLIANLTMLLNLNRLPHWNYVLADLNTYLPKYMARITRCWRHASALRMPPFWKAHAIRNGMIAYVPNILAPTIRLWSCNGLLAHVSGGPDITDPWNDLDDLFTTDLTLGQFVEALETTERWLRMGETGIITDFTAVKDLIDMTRDITPGTFDPGLPDSAKVPGLSGDQTLATDLLRRAVFRKDKVPAGTDQWIIYPIPNYADYGEMIPIVGFGAPTIYDFTLLGAAKYGHFTGDLTSLVEDVNTAFRYMGTDYHVRAQGSVGEIRDVFGLDGSAADLYDEVIGFIDSTGAVAYSKVYDAFDCNSASPWRTQLLQDPIRRMNPWDIIRAANQSGWTDLWKRMTGEKVHGYQMWVDPQDLGQNYAEFLARSLGIPFLG